MKYQELKEAGICVHCRKVPAIKGKVLCESCGTRNRAAARTSYREKRAKGICTDCGGKAEEGHARCAECQEIVNGAGRITVSRYRRLYQERKLRKLCPRCGKRKPARGRAYCASCMKSSLGNRKRLVAKRKATKHCTQCGAPVTGFTLCLSCRRKAARVQSRIRAERRAKGES